MWRLQRGTDAECKTFQAMANAGHYRGSGSTRQGIYVCTPAGELLASVNTLNADRVLETLEKGLTAWRELPEERRGLASPVAAEPAHRWEFSYPEDGLVLRSWNHDVPASEWEPLVREGRWNKDHVWFTADEAMWFLPLALTAGDATVVGATVVERLARYHLVDNVRGQALPFTRDEVSGSRLDSRLLWRDGDLVGFEITGTTTAASDGVWRMGDNDWKPRGEFPRSITAEVLGYAVYDHGRERFTHFEMVAVGDWVGRSWLNGRGRQSEGRVGFYFELAPDTPSERVAPAYIDIYDADWVRQPN